MTRAATLFTLLATPALALAQPLPDAPDHPGDRHELRQDRHELARDRWDLAAFQQLLARFEDARSHRARRAIAAVEADTLRMLDRAVRQARVELARSAGEVRRDRRDLRGDVAEGDRRDFREDRRDLRDDRRDLRDDRRDLVRVKAIRGEFWSLRGRMDPRSLDRKQDLLAELVRMAHGELREDRRELREDRREGWEQQRP